MLQFQALGIVHYEGGNSRQPAAVPLPYPKGSLQKKKTDLYTFFLSILFISVIRLKSVENKHNLSITKAQILPQDKLKNGENQA